jgi:hypothetical protein
VTGIDPQPPLVSVSFVAITTECLNSRYSMAVNGTDVMLLIKTP